MPEHYAYHDCNYVKARNKLIPEAANEASEHSRNPYQWTRKFVEVMDRLVRQSGHKGLRP